MPETEIRFVKFVTPRQHGQAVRWPGGIETIVGRQGANVRLELVAHGPIADAILATINGSLPKVGEAV